MPLEKGSVLVFDLDDTLYPERDFVVSGFQSVATAIDPSRVTELSNRLLEWFDEGVANPFGRLIDETESSLPLPTLIRIYREHAPRIQLAELTRRTIEACSERGHPMGILTDGRSMMQRNKLQALDLEGLFELVIISAEIGSEKPSPRNYRRFEERFPQRPYVYIGDNPMKDFVTPNRRGWQTIGVRDQGHNIHPQNELAVPDSHRPHRWVRSLA